MLDYLRDRSTPPTDLLGIIAHVRRRWRLKLALRGAMYVLATAFALFLIAAYGMETVRFTSASIIASRVVLAVAFLAAVYWFLVRPLRRSCTDEQVALYLEEHEPSLEATVLSAVEAARSGDTSSRSEALVNKVVEQAIEVCVRMDAARRADEVPIKRSSLALAGIAAVAVLALLVGPAFLRNALSALVLLSRSVEAASPYRLEVTPGNLNVPKGSDQTVTAKLLGFTTEDVALMARRTPTAAYEELPVIRNEDGTFEGMVFDVMAPLDYYVVAEGVRSEVYRLTVVDVPYVQRLDLEYHYPAYTGLEPEKIEDAGDIAVLRGTEVRVHITPTMKTPGGRIALNDKESVALTTQPDGTMTASFTANADGFYRVEFDAPSGERVAGSPQYTIDVLTDQAPRVTFNRPGRDSTVSPIEEFFVEASAEDDFGVRDLELVYSVNGAEEKTIKLFAGNRRLAEVTAGHTFYMEEMNVQPGDSVSYYARAMDNDAVGGAKRTISDLYFLRIRPFNKDFRQAQSQGGGGGGGGGGAGGQVEALSQQQRQIISATHNVNRDRRNLSAAKLRENSKVVELSQSKLRDQVEGLITRMNSQLVERDPAFAKIAELLPQAVASMKEAEAQLAAAKPEVALQPENKALQLLQRAEEEYETQIQVSRQQGGGGGGGGGAMQQELAELFEQELDQMASRYETAGQASQQQADREVDELLEKLKELARRQEQEAERQARRRALEGQMSGGGSSGAQQRALADQLEEVARRLERLSREEQRQELAEAAREARQAADQLRRSAAGDAGAQARAQQALEGIERAQRQLERSQTQRAQRDIEDALRKTDEIARQQREAAEMARKVPTGTGRQQAARQVIERRDQVGQRLSELENQLDRAARDASRDERDASRKMAEAAGEIRDNRLQDRIRYSNGMVGRADPTPLAEADAEIARGIQEVRERLQEAQSALGGERPEDAREEATDRARRLARAADSLGERMQERLQQGQRGQQGREGQQGERGQQGQQGQEGQQGSQGQQGQGGQQGQQGQGGQQGQQGQGGQEGQGGQGGNADGRGGDFGRNANGFDRGGARDGGVWNGGWGGWWDGQLSDEDIRQFRGEIGQLARDTRDLRGMLNGIDIDPRELEEVMRALRQLEDPRVYKDVAELARLQTTVAEGLKRFEFGLRRQVEGEQNAIVLNGTDESPEAYKRLNEEYFKSLAQTPR